MINNSRYIAYNILRETLDGGYLNLLLKKYLKVFDVYEDKRFCNALVSSTLERLYYIDYVISINLSKKSIKKAIRNILRIGVCQILFMDSVPDRAAVNETVKLCSLLGKHAYSGFVNALLRNVCKNKNDYSGHIKCDNELESLSINYSYPLWICNLLTEQYGYDEASSILAHIGDNNKVCFRLKTGNFPDQYTAGLYISKCFYLESTKDISECMEYMEGKWSVMTESSVICVEAAGLSGTERILDLCAAPGNKGLVASERCKSVVLCDVHQNRLDLISRNAERLNASNVSIMFNDALVLNDAFINSFDCVFCDVPCSEMGLMYRKPDIRYHKKEQDIKELVTIQKSILKNASKYVRKGGHIIYSTCTIDKKENSEIINDFICTRRDFSIEDISEVIPHGLKGVVENKMLQILPYRDNIDGFFICKLKRN